MSEDQNPEGTIAGFKKKINEINSDKTKKMLNSVGHKASEKFYEAKNSVEEDVKTGNLGKIKKNKYILGGCIVGVVFLLAFLFLGSSVPSDILERAIFDDAGEQFLVEASEWSPELMTLQALGQTVDVAKLVELTEYEITNSYEALENNEKYFVYDYDATLAAKQNGKTGNYQGTVYITKRGNSWYAN